MLRRLVAILLMVGIGHLSVASSVAACLARVSAHAASHCGDTPPPAPHHASQECCQMGAACAAWAPTTRVLSVETAVIAVPVADQPRVLHGLTVAPETPPPRA